MVVAEKRMVVGDHVSATDSGGCRGKRRYHHLLLQALHLDRQLPHFSFLEETIVLVVLTWEVLGYGLGPF